MVISARDISSVFGGAESPWAFRRLYGIAAGASQDVFGDACGLGWASAAVDTGQ